MTHQPETVPCKLCANPTPMLGTKLCDRCWELTFRIRRDLNLARKVIAEIEEKQAQRYPAKPEGVPS